MHSHVPLHEGTMRQNPKQKLAWWMPSSSFSGSLRSAVVVKLRPRLDSRMWLNVTSPVHALLYDTHDARSGTTPPATARHGLEPTLCIRAQVLVAVQEALHGGTGHGV